jgi:hypothetical protein
MRCKIDLGTIWFFKSDRNKLSYSKKKANFDFGVEHCLGGLLPLISLPGIFIRAAKISVFLRLS